MLSRDFSPVSHAAMVLLLLPRSSALPGLSGPDNWRAMLVKTFDGRLFLEDFLSLGGSVAPHAGEFGSNLTSMEALSDSSSMLRAVELAWVRLAVREGGGERAPGSAFGDGGWLAATSSAASAASAAASHASCRSDTPRSLAVSTKLNLTSMEITQS